MHKAVQDWNRPDPFPAGVQHDQG